MKRTKYKKHLEQRLKSSNDTNKILRELKKEVIKANARLDSLSRHNKANTFASKKLQEKMSIGTINAWNYKKQKIKIPKNLNKTQIMAIRKSINQFFNSKTSTYKGIKEVTNKTKESIKKTISIEGDISDIDAMDYYNMLSDNDFDFFSEQIGASTVWDLIADAKEYNQTPETFSNVLSSYIISDDLDVKDKALKLYNKYL